MIEEEIVLYFDDQRQMRFGDFQRPRGGQRERHLASVVQRQHHSELPAQRIQQRFEIDPGLLRELFRKRPTPFLKARDAGLRHLLLQDRPQPAQIQIEKDAQSGRRGKLIQALERVRRCAEERPEITRIPARIMMDQELRAIAPFLGCDPAHTHAADFLEAAVPD